MVTDAMKALRALGKKKPTQAPTDKKPEPLHDPKKDPGSMDIKPKNKGGRPKKAHALTPAEKQKAYRERQRNAAT